VASVDIKVVGICQKWLFCNKRRITRGTMLHLRWNHFMLCNELSAKHDCNYQAVLERFCILFLVVRKFSIWFWKQVSHRRFYHDFSSLIGLFYCYNTITLCYMFVQDQSVVFNGNNNVCDKRNPRWITYYNISKMPVSTRVNKVHRYLQSTLVLNG
jgi:hypothetical protein